MMVKFVTALALSVPIVVEGFFGGGSSISTRITDNNGSTASMVTSGWRGMTTTIQPSFIMLPTKKIMTSSASSSSKLFLSDVNLPLAEQQQNEDDPVSLREKDTLQFLKMQISSMNLNAFINTALLLIVSISVLNAVATVDAGIMRGWTTEEIAVRIPVDNWFSYSSVLAQQPIATKAATSATVYTIGDMISQATEGKSIGEIDRPRVIRSMLAGLIGHGPLSHVWYDVSENLFENVLHLEGWGGTGIKVAIDQLTWGPFWNNTYILLLGLMKLNKPQDIFDEMKRTTIPLIKSGLKLWPLAHLVTYGLIPVQNRLLWVDMVEIVWVVILATAASEGAEPKDEDLSSSAVAVSDESSTKMV